MKAAAPRKSEAKPINVGNVDAELWERFRHAAKNKKKTTIVNYLEEALREKLERDGF